MRRWASLKNVTSEEQLLLVTNSIDLFLFFHGGSTDGRDKLVLLIKHTEVLSILNSWIID